MNEREKKAHRNFYHAAMQLTGGLENITMDYPKGSPSYNAAVDQLNDFDGLLQQVYRDGTTMLLDDGFTCWDKRTVTAFIRDINFLGRDRLLQLAEKALTRVLDDGICIG